MVDFKQRSTIKHTWAKDFGVFYGKGGRMMHHLRSGGDDGTVRRISVCYVSNIRITPNYQLPPGLELSWYGHNLEQTSMICVHIYNIECILTRSISGISYKIPAATNSYWKYAHLILSITRSCLSTPFWTFKRSWMSSRNSSYCILPEIILMCWRRASASQINCPESL